MLPHYIASSLVFPDAHKARMPQMIRIGLFKDRDVGIGVFPQSQLLSYVLLAFARSLF